MTTTETLREACPTCDRVECPNWTLTPADAGGMSDAEWNAYSTRGQNAFDECQRHAVDWRAEALRLRTLTTEAAAGTGGEPMDEEVKALIETLAEGAGLAHPNADGVMDDNKANALWVDDDYRWKKLARTAWKLGARP